MAIPKAFGPPRPLNLSLIIDPQRGPLAPFGIPGGMTKDTNGAGPELIVLGRDEAGKPQAARFPAGHHGQGRQGDGPDRLHCRKCRCG